MNDPDIPQRRSRREFLRRAAAWTALGGTGVSALTLASAPARAADYRALLCVFLAGGNDGMNMVVPGDAGRYAQYASVRGALALPLASLVPLAGTNYGLHPSLSSLAAAAADGQLVPVFNAGPLRRAVTKSELLAALAAGDAGVLPDSLFSHADQQVLWATGGADVRERTGWGGRAMAALGSTAPVVSVGGNARIGLSQLQESLVLPGPGADFGAFGLTAADLGWAPFATRKLAIDALYTDDGQSQLGDAYRRIQRDAFDVSARLAALVKARPGDLPELNQIDGAFAPLTAAGGLTTNLAGQLYQVAKLVAMRGSLQADRQIFCAQLDGFDTHGNQVDAGSPTTGAHARLLQELGDALAAFHAAMTAIGLGAAVTSFTLSDFGRTFVPNQSLGTDHGWGNHHLVLGAAVKGGAGYGRYPDLQPGGPDDVGVAASEPQGRWLPTLSVEDYVAPLLGWLGLDDAALAQALPHRTAGGALGFI